MCPFRFLTSTGLANTYFYIRLQHVEHRHPVWTGALHHYVPLLSRLSATAEALRGLCSYAVHLPESRIWALRSTAPRMTHTFRNLFPTSMPAHLSTTAAIITGSFRCTAAASDRHVVLRGSMAQSLVHYGNPGQVHHRDLPSTPRPLCLHLSLFITFSSPSGGPHTAHPGSSVAHDFDFSSRRESGEEWMKIGTWRQQRGPARYLANQAQGSLFFRLPNRPPPEPGLSAQPPPSLRRLGS